MGSEKAVIVVKTNGQKTRVAEPVGLTTPVLSDDGTEPYWIDGDAFASGMAGGTSFPGGPSSGDLFYRTDLHLQFFYDGTRWLTLSQYTATIRRVGTVAEPMSATGNPGAWPLLESIWVEDFFAEFFVASGGSALSGSHKWVLTLRIRDADGTTLTDIGTVSIDSGSSNLWRALVDTSVDAATAATDIGLVVTATKTGTPGDLTTEIARINYRLIAT